MTKRLASYLAICLASYLAISSAWQLLAPVPALAQEQARSQQLEHSDPYQQVQLGILIQDRGKPIYSWFGHAGIVLSGPATALRAIAADNRQYFAAALQYNGDELVFDYGNYDSSSGSLLFRFLLGGILYFKAIAYYQQYFLRTASEKRGLSVYWLNLDAEQKRQFSDILFYETSPAQRTYPYHFYRDNCLTRIRDQLDRVFGGGLKQQVRGQSADTIRQLLQQQLGDKFFGMLLLTYLQGSQIDQQVSRWDSVFFPIHLPALLESLQLPGSDQPLVSKVETLFPHAASPSESRAIYIKRNIYLLIYICSVFFVSAAFWRKKRLFLLQSPVQSVPVWFFWTRLSAASYLVLSLLTATVLGLGSAALWLGSIAGSFEGLARQNAFLLLGTPLVLLQLLLLPLLALRRLRPAAAKLLLANWRIHAILALLLPVFAWLQALLYGRAVQDILLPWLAIAPLLVALACPADCWQDWRDWRASRRKKRTKTQT